MLQVQSRINVADNSGAKQLQIVAIPGVSKQKYARLGDEVSAVVKGAAPTGQVKDGQVVRAVVVRVRKEQRRRDGSYVRFDDNAGVVIDKNGNPLGTRVMGPIAQEVKDAGYTKIASLAPEVI